MVAFGDTALIAFPGPGDGSGALHRLCGQTRGAPVPVLDAVAGIDSLTVITEPGAQLDALAEWLSEATLPDGALPAPRQVRIPVVWGGPDTEQVCADSGVGPEELAGLLGAARLRVAAVGFSPGFAYLTGVPPPLDRVARLPRPRPRVPAGSVALAGAMAAVYPQATPGGWALVGWSPEVLFDPASPPYARLAPGDEVSFSALAGPVGPPPAGPAGNGPPARAPLDPGAARSALVVEDPGALALVQDAGRRGVAGIGVPRAGPADPLAHGLANRLVGNAPGAPAVEATLRGPVLRALRPVLVALAGAPCRPTVDGRSVGDGHVVPLGTGQTLDVGPVAAGLRTYLAVRGGIDVPASFASRSTDTLAWLGPGPLRARDVLGLASVPSSPPADRLTPPARRLLAVGPAPPVLRILAGPHSGWFEHDALTRLAAQPWTVESASDRVGLRLAGAEPLRRRRAEIRSLGMVHGAVQIPPDGMPVVLGPDHATLGGYPVVAVVVAADRHLLGQCRPGDEVRFEVVDPAGAAAAWKVLAHLLGGQGVTGTYPVAAG